jgi:hypothetical protein
MTLTHSTVVVVADDGTSPVGTTEWNADHVVSGTTGQLQYNNSSALTGAAELFWESSVGQFSVGRGATTGLFWGSEVKFEIVATSAWWLQRWHVYANNAFAPSNIFTKTRGVSPDSQVILQDGDDLLDWICLGSDGTDYVIATRLEAEIEGTPGINSMPGRWKFSTTPSGSASPVNRLIIHSDGTVERTARNIDTVVTLTDGATVALDASLGNYFKLLAAGNRTISAPTNKPAAGKVQRIIIMHEASGADRTLALTTGSAGAFRFGTDITALTATTSGLVDYIGCIYNVADDRWDVVSISKGY